MERSENIEKAIDGIMTKIISQRAKKYNLMRKNQKSINLSINNSKNENKIAFQTPL
jgi:hypothetical protein